MKKLFCKFLCVMDSFARARAATELTRNGRSDDAKKLMEEAGKCKC